MTTRSAGPLGLEIGRSGGSEVDRTGVRRPRSPKITSERLRPRPDVHVSLLQHDGQHSAARCASIGGMRWGLLTRSFFGPAGGWIAPKKQPSLSPLCALPLMRVLSWLFSVRRPAQVQRTSVRAFYTAVAEFNAVACGYWRSLLSQSVSKRSAQSAFPRPWVCVGGQA